MEIGSEGTHLRLAVKFISFKDVKWEDKFSFCSVTNKLTSMTVKKYFFPSQKLNCKVEMSVWCSLELQCCGERKMQLKILFIVCYCIYHDAFVKTAWKGSPHLAIISSCLLSAH